MKKGITKSGFKFTISNEIANDYELVELLVDLEQDTMNLIKVVNKVLGKKQTNDLKEHLRNNKGIVPTDLMMKEIEEIFQAEEEVKNS